MQIQNVQKELRELCRTNAGSNICHYEKKQSSDVIINRQLQQSIDPMIHESKEKMQKLVLQLIQVITDRDDAMASLNKKLKDSTVARKLTEKMLIRSEELWTQAKDEVSKEGHEAARSRSSLSVSLESS